MHKKFLAFVSLQLYSLSLSGASFQITQQDVDATGGLKDIINQVNASSDTSNQVTINISGLTTPTFTWNTGSGNIPPIFPPNSGLSATRTVTIDGNVVISGVTQNMTLDGSNVSNRGFMVQTGTVTLQNLNLDHLVAQGGNGGDRGGGGGLGAGGALFVGNPSSLTPELIINNVTFGSGMSPTIRAVGGDGGTATNLSGSAGAGGGGLGGNGGGVLPATNVGAGGGGGGLFGAGGAGGGFGGGGGGGGLLGNGGTGGTSGDGINAGSGGGGGGYGSTPSNSNGGNGQNSPPGAGNGGNGGGPTGGIGGTPPAMLTEPAGNGGSGGINGGGGGGGGGNTDFSGLDNGANGGPGGQNGGGGGGVNVIYEFENGVGGNGGNSGVNGGGGGAGGGNSQTVEPLFSGSAGAGEWGGGGGGLGSSPGTNVMSPGGALIAGAGGFGGGGGAAFNSPGSTGGQGGFGAGGGNGATGGAAGPFGGAGGSGQNIAGGGGGALGGIMFIDQNTTLTLQDKITIVQPGSLTAGTGANTGSASGLTVFIRSGGTLNYNASLGSALTLDQVAGGNTNSGGGLALASTNLGTLFLTGVNNYTGSTQVMGGSLGGTGTISNTGVTASSTGNILPGMSNAVGTLTAQSFTFNPGSSLTIQATPSQASEIVASTSTGVSISNTNTTLNIVPMGFTKGTSSTYTIVSTPNPGNLSGQFTSVIVPMGFSAQLVYDPAQFLMLTLTALSFNAIVPSGNAGAVATAFAQLSPSDPDVAFLNQFLDLATSSQLQCDFDQMQPALYNAIPIVMESAMTTVRKTLSDRMREIHTVKCRKKSKTEKSVYAKANIKQKGLPDDALIACSEAMSSEIPVHHATQEISLSAEDIINYKLEEKSENASSPFSSFILEENPSLALNQEDTLPSTEISQPKERKWGFWIAPVGNFDRQRSRSQNGQCNQTKIGFHANTYGTAIGLDGPLGEHFVLGGALAYTHTNLNWKESQAHSHTNNLYAALFATWFNDRGYMDLAFTGGYDWIEAKRKIHLVNTVSSLNRHARHKNEAQEYDAHFGTGFTFTPALCWQLRPFLTVDYIYIHENDYREEGAKSIDLHVNSKNSNLLRDEIGAYFGYLAENESFSFSPEVKLSYVREDRFDGKNTHAQFVHSHAGFEVSGFKPHRNLISPGASMTFYWPKKYFSAALRYNGEFGNNWYNQIASAELLYRF